MTFNIHNKLRLFTKHRKEPYRSLHKILGFYPKNIELYKLALLHRSQQVRENGRLINNERLEFLGDAVLGAIVSDALYEGFERKPEGFLTNTRSKIVQRSSLNALAVEIGLHKLMDLPKRRNFVRNNIYGNAFEAFVGAVYLDCGYKKCRKFILNRILHRVIDLEKLVDSEHNFKSRLLEWSQKHRVTIDFELIEQYVTSENKPVFHSQVYINMMLAGDGKGNSKRESQQKAAFQALQKIKEEPQFWGQKEKEMEIDDKVEEEIVEQCE
ncbi:MAG: ribonuclease III [Prevotellaceae bacterium]|jgi:ribonuclease-3|nr:ribonuclease III [Prevotellaceae bacterium]